MNAPIAELLNPAGATSTSVPRTSSYERPSSGRLMNCSAVISPLVTVAVYGWVHRSATLFEPRVAEQVVIDGEQGAIVQQQRVVLARDRVLAPPLVVNAPVVVDAADR